MDAWQIILLVFFALLPVVLMLDFWGEERCDARGVPKPRPWPRGPHSTAAGDEPDAH